MNVHWLPPPSSGVCWQLNVPGQEITHPVRSPLFCHVPPGQRCGTICPNSFGNWTSPSDNSNDCCKRLWLVSWAAAPCVWMLRALTRNLLTYLLTYFLASFYICNSVLPKSNELKYYTAVLQVILELHNPFPSIPSPSLLFNVRMYVCNAVTGRS